MPPSLVEKIRARLARDKNDYWWKSATDYELSLSKMSLSELARELQDMKVRKEVANTIIVEHMLTARLVRIQSRASWGSGWLAFAGAVLAAALSFYLGRCSADQTKKLDSIPTQKSDRKSVQESAQNVIPPIKNTSPEPREARPEKEIGNGKQPNFPSKP